MIEIKRIKAEKTYTIRREVLRNNMDLPYTFYGDNEKDTFHLGCYLNSQLIGVVSFMPSSSKDLKGKQYQLRGMATLQNFQGKGYGKEMIFFGLTILKEKQTDVVWCNARIAAVKFYHKVGFQKLGSEFEIPKIGGHFVMFKKIAE